MADQKVKIDIDINSDALNQLPKYKAGFDGLRDAVNNLNKEIKNSTAELSKMNTQNKEADTWGTKLKNTVTNLSDTYNDCKDAIDTAVNALSDGWIGAIAAAFTLVTTYGPQVLDYLNEIFQSDKTKEAAKNLKNYNELMDIYFQNVSEGMSQSSVLIQIGKDEGENWNNRIEAIQKLNRLAPEQLKNLNIRNINTKEGKKLIDEYTKSLERSALIEAAQSKIKPLIEKRLALEEQVNSAQQDWNDYKTGKKKNEDREINNSSSAGITVTSAKYTLEDVAHEKYQKLKQQKEAIEREINTLTKQANQKLVQYVSKPLINKSQNKEYWENELANLQKTLDNFDASASDFESRAKPIAAKIKNAQKMLSMYNVSTTEKRRINISIPKPPKPPKPTPGPDPEIEFRQESINRMALLTLQGYEREYAETNQHFDQQIRAHKNNNATVEQLEAERLATLQALNKKFQEEGLTKLANYQTDLNKISKDARTQALQQLKADYESKEKDVRQIQEENQKIVNNLQEEIFSIAGQDPTKLTQQQIEANFKKVDELTQRQAEAQKVVDQAKTIAEQLKANQTKDTGKLQDGYNAEDKKAGLEDSLLKDQADGNWQQEFIHQKQLLDMETQQAIEAAKGKEGAIAKIKHDAKLKLEQLDKARLEAEVANQKQYVKNLDSLSTAVTSIFGKNTVAARIAFKAHQAAAAAQVIIDTRQAIMGIWKSNSGLPIIGVPKAIAETAVVAATGAANLAAIIKQKPGFAQGGQFTSDGRGALLSGYSRTDNTNAYLRSGEAVVVSEAMRNPWARNLVSAINVAYGGRDFSVANPGYGYAIGGIFTDGGNANRYYSQPVHDQKDLANTLAYQMINNFPPIYVDVKDVNNQQNILAQTVNRVNL